MELQYVYLRNDYPSCIAEQMKQLKDTSYDEVIVESADVSDHSKLIILLSKLKSGDVLIVPNIRVLTLRLKRLNEFFGTLESKRVRFISLVDQVDSKNAISFYDGVHFINSLISEQERLGLYTKYIASEKNKVGRPCIDEHTVKEIQSLYYSQDLTMRQIAELTNVAIGTVYKYIQFNNQEKSNV